VELQVPRLPPDFLSGLVVSVDLMRLSLEKAAYVAVYDSTVVGNPESAPDDKGEGDDFCEEPSDRMERKKRRSLEFDSSLEGDHAR
jgi:hypothetical protein